MNYYFHIPFCFNKCAYCAFYSTTEVKFDDYFQRLKFDLENSQWDIADTIYFGGGTPTIFSATELKELFNLVFANIPISTETEISIEANPETLNEEKIDIISKYCNRLSLGVQSFSEKLRNILGRKCSDNALINAITLLKKSSITNLNMDLIYAINNQSLDDWKNDLRRALDCGITHLSCYNLTAEENSLLGNDTPVDESLAIEMYQLNSSVAKEYSLNQYEISNFAKDDFRCRHNVNVWQGKKLKGFGPSASSFNGFDRYCEVANFNDWLAKVAPEEDKISVQERLAEIFAINLRTIDGWQSHQWQKVINSDLWNVRLEVAENIAKQFGYDMINITPKKINLTPKGLMFWNDIAEFII